MLKTIQCAVGVLVAAIIIAWLPQQAAGAPTTEEGEPTPTQSADATPTITIDPEKEYVFVEMNAIGRAVRTANLRSVPEWTTEEKYTIGTLQKDTEVIVTGQRINDYGNPGYYRIVYNGEIYYISNNYLEIIGETTVDPDLTRVPTPTPTTDPALLPTVTPDPNATPTATPDPNATPTPTVTPDPNATPTPTVTPVPESTPTPDATPEPTKPDATATPTDTDRPADMPTPDGSSVENQPSPTESPIPKTPEDIPSDGGKTSAESTEENDRGDLQWWFLLIPGGLILLGLLAMIRSLSKRR